MWTNTMMLKTMVPLYLKTEQSSLMHQEVFIKVDSGFYDNFQNMGGVISPGINRFMYIKKFTKNMPSMYARVIE